MNNERNYFSDDCIVEDAIYLGLKNLLICPLCKNIFKKPLMCSICQGVFCKKCIEENIKSKICPNNCQNINFKTSILKNELLSGIKYRCKNCSEEVMQKDINAHLKSNCTRKFKRSLSLAEIYQTKRKFTQLSSEEMSEIDKNKINHFTSKKNKKYNYKYSNNFR